MPIPTLVCTWVLPLSWATELLRTPSSLARRRLKGRRAMLVQHGGNRSYLNYPNYEMLTIILSKYFHSAPPKDKTVWQLAVTSSKHIWILASFCRFIPPGHCADFTEPSVQGLGCDLDISPRSHRRQLQWKGPDQFLDPQMFQIETQMNHFLGGRLASCYGQIKKYELQSCPTTQRGVSLPNCNCLIVNQHPATKAFLQH